MIKPYNRRELYIEALSDSSLTIPNYPYSREETYLAKINGQNVTIPAAPANRYETYLAKLAGESVTVPTPVSRLEMFLAKACGEDVEPPPPVSRKEELWQAYIDANAGEDITELFELTDGYCVSYGSGSVPTSTRSAATRSFVDISAYTSLQIMMTTSKGTALTGLAFYAEAKAVSYISGVMRPESGAEGVILVDVVIPENAHYVRTTYWASTIVAEKGYDAFYCIGKK